MKRYKPLVLLVLIGAVVAAVYHLGYLYKNRAYIEIADICLQGENPKPFGKSAQEYDAIIERLRHCIHNNSYHMIDEEFYATAKTGKRGFTSRVLAYARGEVESRPHMECSSRSKVLNKMYNVIGYKSENVLVVSQKDNFLDHVLVRVRNPKTKEYQAQDPTFDVYYKAVESDKRLDMPDLIKRSEEEFTPCGLNAQCDWAGISPDERSPFRYVHGYWNLAYLNLYGGGKGTLIHNSEFDPFTYKRTVNGELLSFCEKDPARCKKIINVLNGDIN